MPKAIEPNEHTSPQLGVASSAMPPGGASPPRRRWTRTRVIWTLILLSIVPGIIASQFREYWEQQVPATARTAAYVVSGLFIAAACGLIMKTPDKGPPPEDERSSGSSEDT